MHAMRMMMMMMITVFEKVTDDRGVRPAPLRLGTDDSICLPPSPKPFFPRGEQFEFKGHTHTHTCVGLCGKSRFRTMVTKKRAFR